MSSRRGRRASNIGSAVDPAQRQALAARQRRQSIQLLRRMSQGQYADDGTGPKRRAKSSFCLQLRSTRGRGGDKDQQTMDSMREERLAKDVGLFCGPASPSPHRPAAPRAE